MLQPTISLQWLLQSHALNSKREIKYCKNQHHFHVCPLVNIFNSINVDFLQFCVQQFEMMYTNMSRQQKCLGLLKKLAKNRIIPNHGNLGGDQNQVLDMANFETNFLSNGN